MKYALVNGIKKLPNPKQSGICAFCGSKVISKCGEVRAWYWSHCSKRDCDVWWENETEWHRNWKGNFPDDWQEVIHYADDGEKHIADVKTVHGSVLEFQHSFITSEERLSRDNFYPKLVWVVDGLRRKRDKEQFFKALKDGVQVIPNPLLMKIYTEESRIVNEWSSSKVPVFFDFGEEQRIWWLLPFKEGIWSYVVPFSRQNFIDFNLGKMSEELNSFLRNCIQSYKQLFHQIEANRRRQQVGINSRRRLLPNHVLRRSRRL